MNIREIKNEIDNGAVFPELVALGHILQYIDSRKCLKSGKITEEFQPLVQVPYERSRMQRQTDPGFQASGKNRPDPS